MITDSLKNIKLPEGLNTFAKTALPTWAFWLLLVLVSYQVAIFTWQIAGLFQRDTTAIQTSNARTATISRTPAEQIPDIALMHLFGNAALSGQPSTPIEAPETRLNLTLHGIYVDPEAENSGAIIGAAGREQKFYKVGQKLEGAPGVTLSEVRSNQVILLRSGKYEALRFPENTLNLSAPPQNISTTIPDAAGIDKQSIMENVRVVPVFAGAEGLKGYRLLPKNNRAVYNKLGIRPTDIVLAINGIELKDQKEAMKVINELYQAQTVELQIERDGNLETLTLDLGG